MKIVNVLSIDAWADGPEDEQGWNWNAWYKVGACDLDTLPEDDAALLAWFVAEGYVNARALTECRIDDDQYNYVICVKETSEPLYAIAYGESES